MESIIRSNIKSDEELVEIVKQLLYEANGIEYIEKSIDDFIRSKKVRSRKRLATSTNHNTYIKPDKGSGEIYDC